MSKQNITAIQRYLDKYGERKESEATELDNLLSVPHEQNAYGLMHDLQDLWLLVNESTIFALALLKAARSLGDQDLEKDIQKIEKRNEHQRDWVFSHIK